MFADGRLRRGPGNIPPSGRARTAAPHEGWIALGSLRRPGRERVLSHARRGRATGLKGHAMSSYYEVGPERYTVWGKALP